MHISEFKKKMEKTHNLKIIYRKGVAKGNFKKLGQYLQKEMLDDMSG